MRARPAKKFRVCAIVCPDVNGPRWYSEMCGFISWCSEESEGKRLSRKDAEAMVRSLIDRKGKAWKFQIFPADRTLQSSEADNG